MHSNICYDFEVSRTFLKTLPNNHRMATLRDVIIKCIHTTMCVRFAHRSRLRWHSSKYVKHLPKKSPCAHAGKNTFCLKKVPNFTGFSVHIYSDSVSSGSYSQIVMVGLHTWSVKSRTVTVSKKYSESTTSLTHPQNHDHSYMPNQGIITRSQFSLKFRQIPEMINFFIFS